MKFINKLLDRLRKKEIDTRIFEKFSYRAYIRNGYGYGFISDNELFDNCWLQVQLGYIRSGYGDWGGGATHAVSGPIIVTLDRDFIVRKICKDDFYNSEDSQAVGREAEKMIAHLKEGDEFVIGNDTLRYHLERIFKLLPMSEHIGYDVFGSPHMLECCMRDKITDEKEKYCL